MASNGGRGAITLLTGRTSIFLVQGHGGRTVILRLASAPTDPDWRKRCCPGARFQSVFFRLCLLVYGRLPGSQKVSPTLRLPHLSCSPARPSPAKVQRAAPQADSIPNLSSRAVWQQQLIPLTAVDLSYAFQTLALLFSAQAPSLFVCCQHS
jgi:hypothetical protein